MALPPGFVLEKPASGINLPPGFVLEQEPQAAVPKDKPFIPSAVTDVFHQFADVPIGFQKGILQGIRMVSDVFGANNAFSRSVKQNEEALAGLMSAQSKNDQQEIARILKEAEDKGVLDQVKAGVKAFTVAPVDTLTSALGTAAPAIVAALGANILGAGALLTTGVSMATGAVMGAGTIKGTIYEETKQALLDAGVSEADAEQRAIKAQEYGGKNLDQILTGAVIGGVAARGPLEKGAVRALASRISKNVAAREAAESVSEKAAKGAVSGRLRKGVEEALPEALQGTQEKVASNIAQQREGLDVPTFRGAVSAGTLEGLAGFGLGAAMGKGKEPAAPQIPPAPPVAPSVETTAATTPPAPPVAPPVTEAPPSPPPAPPVAPVAETPAVETPAVETPVTPGVAETPTAPTAETTAPQAPPAMATPDGTKFTFETAKGSQYFVFEDGTTQRNKAPRPEHPGDQGVKERTARTIYVDGDASRLSAAGVTGMEGARVIIDDDGTASLVWKNPQTGQLGSSPISSKIKFYTEPAIGRSPLELWNKTEVAGREGYSGMHAGNKIVKLTPVTATTPQAPAVSAVEMLSEPTEEAIVKKEPATRKEAQAFGKDIGAAQPYPGELRGRVNLSAQKAAKEGNFQGVLSALEKSKNVIVAEIAKRAKFLGTKIVIDDNAEETYTGPSPIMRQMSIDGAKMHLEALNKIRALAPQVDALPDGSPLWQLGENTPTAQTIEGIDNGEPTGSVSLARIADSGHSMFAPLSTGPIKLRTKEDFKRLQKAYEDLTAEYGENALQLTSTGSAQITGVAGVYDADTDTIRVPEYNSRREDVLAHEIVHAQTVQAIANPSLRQKPIVARLNKLYEHVKKELEGGPGRAPYGIQSIQEFVAEGMGNPAFQFLLKKIKYENTSAWDSFVQTIANLIGVKRDTAFTELLSIYSDLTTEQKAALKAEAPAAETPAADVAQQVKDLREQQTKLLTKSGKVPAPRSPARQKYDVLERQIAELENRQLAVRTQKPRKPPKTIMGSPMLAGIFNQIGGLHTSLLPEFSTRFFTKKLDKKGRPIIMVRNPMIPGYGTLFNKNGKFDFGEIAEHLEAEGYLEPGSLERDYKDAGERAKELVKRALNGEEVLPIDEQIAKDASEREASERQKALDRQEENRQIATGELQLEPEFGWTNEQFEQNLGLDREFETDLEMYNLEPKDLEFLSDEELESELTDAEREQAQARRTRKAEEDAARQKVESVAPGEDEALLTRPTAEGLKAKQEAAEKAAAEEKKAKSAEQERLRKEQQAKEEKARADETVKDFELGKSAEEQMTGMGDLFAAPSVPVAPPTLDTTGIKEVKGRHPQVQAAAKLLQDKKMTREEFEKYVDYYKPIQEVEAEKLLPPTSEQRMNETVNADKRDKINVPVADGTKVGLRMDLPARERGGSVVSIHEGKPGKLTVGKLMGFRSTGWLKDVTFEVRSQEKGLAVATGAAKAPQQTVEGTWFNLGPEETYARVKELMKDPAWTQVGFDPSRHGYFYDRKTREPVVSASEMYQVGQFLLAKDVKYAPKTDFLYSLGKEQTRQLQDFQQTLRNLLNKFGLKDVGLNIEEGMRDAGSYSQQLIRIASDEANPIRTLRHEAIHALRELGFFTDAQWKSLSKMAKDKWIDQYLKQRNEQGRPLKAGEESRYDAYMREYNGDMEKITEEAVADAFADFDATKPPAGMLQALLKRMKDLFQSIKSALTKIESPEQIFGKVERGELKAGAKAEAGERKSLGKTADPGQQALETIRTMGMDVPKPDPTKLEKAKDIWTKAKEDPKLTAQSAARAMRNFLDKVETWSFSSDAKLNNDYRRAIVSDIKENEGVIGQLLEMSQSQAVHADALASQFMIEGGLKYNDELKKWESFDAKANFPALSKKLDEIGKQYNLSKEQIERVAHAYLVAKRLPGLIERNRQLDEEITAERATAKPDKKKIQDLEDKKVFISDRQLEQMEPGLSLGKTIPELNQVVNMWNDIRKNTIDVMVNSGLWSPEYAQAMWDNMDYVPYFREDQIENEKGPQEFIRGLQVKSKEFQLKGSEDAVHDVFDNMIRWTQYAINRSVRAHKALQMIDNSKDIKVGDRKMAEKVTEEKRGMNIVRVFRDGKQELYDMADPLYVQAFAGIQNVSIPTLKFMSKISDILRNSVVLYPLFSVAQVPQDSFAAMFTSGLKTQHALKIPYLAVKEFVKTLAKTSQTHEVLKKFGATGVRDFSATVIRDDAEIYAGLKPPRGGWGKTKEFLSHISMAADNAVRQAVYEASIQQGVSRSEAIEKAFEVINFRRKGTSKMLNILGQTVPFFYAYLSAQRVAYKVLTGVGISPTDRAEAFKTLAMTSTAVATLSLLYAMANADDEDYMETPANIRDRTITIPGSGGVRIPLRPDFFLFPKIIAEHTYLLLSEQGYQDAAKFRTSMKDALISAIASPTPFPTAIKPAIEVAINYDFFQGKPLIGNFEKQKDLERQFRDSTSEFAKLLGQTGMISPIAADHLIRGMFGSFGGLFLFGTNQFLHSDPDVPRPEMNATEMLAALPGTSGLLKRPQESALKNDFYTLRDEVEKAVNTFNDIKTRSPEGMEAFLADEKQMARLMLGKSVDKINRELSKIRRQITIVTNMPESQMSAEDKADFKRQLMEMERELLRSVNVKELREMAKI